MPLENKKVLITGASGGIGFEFCKQLVASRATVFAVSRSGSDKLDAFAKAAEGRLIIVKGDITTETGLKELYAQVQAETEYLDLLINNAGTYEEDDGIIEKLRADTLRATFEVNAIAPVMVTKTFYPFLRMARKHTIPKLVNITSLMGSIDDNSSGGSYAYRMSKAALNMFTKCFAVEHRDIVTLCLHPGWVQTEMGGPSAPITPKESVAGMLKVIQTAEIKNTGKFYDFEGDQVPW